MKGWAFPVSISPREEESFRKRGAGKLGPRVPKSPPLGLLGVLGLCPRGGDRHQWVPIPLLLSRARHRAHELGLNLLGFLPLLDPLAFCGGAESREGRVLSLRGSSVNGGPAGGCGRWVPPGTES